MSTVIKDLGAVSAYAYAVEKGYTGTEAEFAELMADYAEVGQRAEDAAESALNSKTAAQTAATTATNKASEATTAAQTATTKAGEAQTSAQTASSKASEASQSASQALTYKNDAESAKTSAQTAKTQAETARDNAVTAKIAAETAQGKAEDAQAAAETAAASIQSSAAQIATNTADIASLEADRYKAFPTDTASGSIASFPDGADDISLKSLVVNIDPVQDLSSGDPSPTNICPITGWTGCEVSATGINIWDEEWEVGGILNGRNISETDKIRSKNYIPVVSRNTYFFYCKTNGLIFLSYYDSDKNYLSSSDGMRNVAVTIPERCRYIRFRMQTVYGTTYKNDICINYPSTDHDYHPYVGTTLPINWQTEAGTVYGGKLDVLTGILTVYPYYASYNGETLTGEWISDRDVYAVGTTPTIGAQVVNIGAEGTEIQLTPHQVNSLLGVNNLWADSGDTEVEYRADTKAYIAKKIAEALASLT